MVSLKPLDSSSLNEDLVRHMILSSLRSYERKFSEDYGELIICCDSKHYWRKNYFSYYKATRKKDREDSHLNWSAIFDVLSKIKDEINQNLHYKVIEVYGAEADDVIAVLAETQQEKILILSGDKDMGQLQQYSNVKQYNPIQKKFLIQENPKDFLKEHIIKGDRSDGIPNVLSQDNTFVSGGRQKPISKRNIEVWIKQNPEEWADTNTLRNYHRNKGLIDFSNIPSEIKENILNTYNSVKDKRKSINLDYFIQKNLVKLLSDFT